MQGSRDGLWLGNQLGLLTASGLKIYTAAVHSWNLSQTILPPDQGTFNNFQPGAAGDDSRLFVPGTSGSIYAYAYNCCGIAQWTFRQKITAANCSSILQLRLIQNTLTVLCSSYATTTYSVGAPAELSVQSAATTLPNSFSLAGASVFPGQAIVIDPQVERIFFYDRSVSGWTLNSEFNQIRSNLGRARLVRFNTETEAIAVFSDGFSDTFAQIYQKENGIWSARSQLNCPSRIGLECRGFPTSNRGKYFWGARSNGQAAIEALILGEFQNGFEY